MKITKLIVITTCLFASMNILAGVPSGSFTFINHCQGSLLFQIYINPEGLPDLPHQFILNDNQSLTTKISEKDNQTYLHAEASKDRKAFFSLEIKNHSVKIHGYISEGISYSWDPHTIIFCSTYEYKKKK